MSLIVHFQNCPDHPGAKEGPSTIIANVQSITFPPGERVARLYIRDDVKTAEVPGFVEHERLVEIAGPVYVMNEAGKTISVYRSPERFTADEGFNAEQVAHMVSRFLAWKLPEDFRPDGGIHFDPDAATKLDPRNRRYEPSGTNLLDARQAEAMVRYMLAGL